MKKKQWLAWILVATMSVAAGCAKDGANVDASLKEEKEAKGFDFQVIPETFEVTVTANGVSESLSEPFDRRVVSDVKEETNQVSWVYKEEQIKVEVTKEQDYLDVSILSTKEGEHQFSWPSISGDAYMMPLNQGKYIKRDDPLWREYFENNTLNTLESLSMPFFGVDKEAYSLVYIMKNRYNNSMVFDTSDGITFEFVHEYPSINPDKEYGFRVYVVDTDVTKVAKIYRDYVMENGNFVTLQEKAEENPNIEKLYGAPHIYFWNNLIISEENIRWERFRKEFPDDLKQQIQNLLTTQVEDGKELATAFDDMKKEEYVDKYTKNRIIKGLSQVLQLEDFFEGGEKGKNPIEVMEQNKQFLKDKLGDMIDPVEQWGNADTLDIIQDMKDSGIEQMWVGFDDWNTGFMKPELVTLAQELGYLVGPYDSYHSIHKPGEEEWITASFPDESLYENATVTNKQGEKIKGFQGEGRKLNPRLAMPSVKERVSSIMETGIGFHSWFLDTDATGEVYDDYSKDHITTQKQDIEARIERMKYLQEDWNLVVGTEGGNDFANSTIAFAHGIETPAFSYMDPDMKNKESEYYVGRYYAPNGGVPEMFSKQIPLKEKYRQLFLDPTYTIPLYKLVYNDSVITTYWWGWGSLKFKESVEERMLYEILYNVPPLYHIDQEEWEKHQDTILNHTQVWSEFSKTVINKEMTKYQVLSENQLVQMTEYGEEITVIANFSNEEVLVEGEMMKPKSLWIIDGEDKVEYIPSV